MMLEDLELPEGMTKEEVISLLAELEERQDSPIEAAGDSDKVCPAGTYKLDADYAGYMELTGAKKDDDCKIVYVEGGISKELGCCNLFHPNGEPDKFSCGTCKYLK